MGTIPLQPNKVFASREEVENLTYDEAVGVIADARNLLMSELASDVDHMHWLDDCGDYMSAALENFYWLWNSYFLNDGSETIVTERVRQFLLVGETEVTAPDDPTPMWGGTDGEVRYTICPFAFEDGE